VIQGYGMTETASLISLNHPFRSGKGSIGRSLPGREIRLAEDGEILVRGESIAAGYWKDRQLERVDVPSGESEGGEDEGWFHTGDLGAFDEQGNLYFKGRKKNVIVTPAGMNVHPEDLEAALQRQPEVRDCVVVGLPRNGNEEPCAVLLLESDDPGAASAAVHRANESLAEHQRMRSFFVWPSGDFPRTPTGKPRLGVIREAAQQHYGAKEGAEEDDGRGAAPSPVSELIARITGKRVGTLAPEANLESDLNLSSLDRVELLSALEDRFQTELSETKFSAAKTVAELGQLLRHPAAQPSDYPYARWPQWPAVAVLRSIVYYTLVWTATVLLAWPRVRGREKLRGLQGPALFICNHVIEHDVGFVLKALPHRWRFRLAVAMNGERLRALRNPPAGRNWFLRLVDRFNYVAVSAFFNVFSMPKQSGVRGSFQFAGETVDRGYGILVFPEGQLTKDGSLMPFRHGIGVLAKTLSLPVVPMRIDGLYKVKLKGRRWAWPGAVRVTIGAPLRFEAGMQPEEITRKLEQAVRGLPEN
jgi:long-chain acyl-CoA synthetase